MKLGKSAFLAQEPINRIESWKTVEKKKLAVCKSLSDWENIENSRKNKQRKEIVL